MAILELAQDHKHMQGVIGDFAREIIRLTAELTAARKAIKDIIGWEGDRNSSEWSIETHDAVLAAEISQRE